MPVSGEAVLGMAAATGELQLYTLSDSQVRNVASEESHQNRLLDFKAEFVPLDQPNQKHLTIDIHYNCCLIQQICNEYINEYNLCEAYIVEFVESEGCFFF